MGLIIDIYKFNILLDVLCMHTDMLISIIYISLRGIEKVFLETKWKLGKLKVKTV